MHGLVLIVPIADRELNSHVQDSSCHRSLNASINRKNIKCFFTNITCENILFTCDDGEYWYPYLSLEHGLRSILNQGVFNSLRGSHHFMWGFKVYTIDCHQPDTTGVSWYLLSWNIDLCHIPDTLTSPILFNHWAICILYQHKLKDIILHVARSNRTPCM